MRYLLGFASGLLAGFVVAAAVIFFNPLTRGQSLPENDSGWVLDYSLKPASTWITTHEPKFPLGVKPADVSLLWESGIRHSVLAAMPLLDQAGGTAAAATRVSVPSSATEFLHSGLVVDDFWLISVPGEGSFLLQSVSNYWPLVRDTVVRVGWFGGDWDGPVRYGPTRGPDKLGAEITGISGQFAATSGRGRERLLVDGYSSDSGLAAVSGELLLEMQRAPRP